MRSQCECGKILSNSTNPEIEYRIYSDDEWIEIVEEEEKYPSPLYIPFPKQTAWLCPECKRLHIWQSDSLDRLALYELVSEVQEPLEE